MEFDCNVIEKCIIPISISTTTTDASIVQMVRDRIRFCSAVGYKPRRAEILFCNWEAEPENIKEESGAEAGSDVWSA
jgi:hypothetical protein